MNRPLEQLRERLKRLAYWRFERLQRASLSDALRGFRRGWSALLSVSSPGPFHS
jgi:hypothetical protein